MYSSSLPKGGRIIGGMVLRVILLWLHMGLGWVEKDINEVLQFDSKFKIMVSYLVVA